MSPEGSAPEVERTIGKQADASLRAGGGEQAGRESSRHFMQAPFPIIVLRGPEHVIELANPQALRLWGRGSEVLGLPLAGALPELCGLPFIGYLDEVLRTGVPYEGRAERARLAKGPKGELEDVYFTFVYAPLRDASGAVEGILVCASDVTAQVLASQEMQRALARAESSEAQFRDVVENLPELAWTTRPDGYIDFYNRRWYEYTGTTQEQMKGWGWESVHDPALLPGIVARWKEALSTGKAFEFEFPLRRADGVYRWFLTRAIPLRDEQGRIVRWFGTNTDVEDVRRARADAEAERSRFHAFFMQAPAPICILDGPEHRYTLVNPLFARLVGRGDLVGKTADEAFPDFAAHGFLEQLDRVYTAGETFRGSEMALRFERRTPGQLEEGFVDVIYEASRDLEGRVCGVLVLAFDVTDVVLARRASERERAAERLARQAAELGAQVGRALVSEDPLPDQLRRCCDALVTTMGAAFARIWTYNPAHEVLELRASAGMYTHLDGPHARVPLGSLKIGQIGATRTAHVTNHVLGDPRIPEQDWARREGLVAFAGHPLVVGDRLVGVVALFTKHELSDAMIRALSSVTDQMALGIDRDESERFRDLFIGMLGHDLRNPLNAVGMGARLLSSAVPESQRRTVGRIQNSVTRMDRMIAQVLDFTRARAGGGIPLSRAPTDLETICTQVVDELATGNPGRSIQVSRAGDARGQWDADRLAQTFSNLVANALAYGRPDAPVMVTLNATPGEIRFSVHNVGPPIRADLLPNLFDPFRRGRQAQTAATEGLGLGLFISKEIVKAHKGTIFVESSEAGGTRFTVVLPRLSA